VGLVTVVWTGVIGGKMVFEHSAGVPTAAMKAEIENRAAGHHHDPGGTDEDERADSAADSAHRHAPGTPPHKH
jgi:hypothetical protein